MKRILAFVYGVACYGVFFGTLGRISLELGKTARMIVFASPFTEHFKEYRVRVEDMSRTCSPPHAITIDPSNSKNHD